MALLTESLMLDLGVLLLGIVTTLYVYVTRHFNHWKNLGIPYKDPTPFLGNMKDTVLGRKSISEWLAQEHNDNKGKPFVGLMAFDRPILLVRDLNLIKHILVKDFNYFPDRTFHPSEALDPMLTKNLFGLNSPRWRQLRAKLSPTFTTGKLKMMFNLINGCGKDLVEYLGRETSPDGKLEVKEAMARYTTDVIATCGFGVEANSLKNPNAEFRLMLRKVVEFDVIRNLKFLAAFLAPKLLDIFKGKMLDENVDSFLRRTVWNIVDYREKNQVVRKDFIHLLMEIRKAEQEIKSNDSSSPYVLEGDDFVAQSFVFMAAGFETSSTTSSFALYELALHPEIQARLRNEIMTVIEKHGGEVTYDGVQEMQYLDMVVSETLRQYPVLAFLDRQAAMDYKIPQTNIVLKKGTSIMISEWAIQNDPEYFPEPEVFNPERFSEENKKNITNFTNMPFGEGPRICIGARLGLLQSKVGLVHVLTHYEVSPCKNTPIPIKYDPTSFLLAAKGGLPLKLTPIK